MSVKNSFKPILLSSVNANTFDGTYKVLTASLEQPCSMITITNGSDRDVTVSYDGGLHDHEQILSGYAFPANFQTNAQQNNEMGILPKGTKISVKGAVGTGLVYLSGWYQV